MVGSYRYAAFISYSSRDAAFARRLHRALETYGIPSSLGQFDLIGGGKRNRIYPVFRDREELAAGHLGDVIEANLKASAALIVVCSPNAAASPWVQKEIEYFSGLGRGDKIFAIVADNAPIVDANGGDATVLCFPPAFRGDTLAGDKLEPLAADARKGKDGFRNAWLKLVAGLIGVTPGQIIDRDKHRRRQQRLALTGSLAVLATTGALVSAWIDAQTWRRDFVGQAQTLLTQGRGAEAGVFAIAGGTVQGAALQVEGRGASDALRATRVGGFVRTLPSTDFHADLGDYMSDNCVSDSFTSDGGGILPDGFTPTYYAYSFDRRFSFGGDAQGRSFRFERHNDCDEHVLSLGVVHQPQGGDDGVVVYNDGNVAMRLADDAYMFFKIAGERVERIDLRGQHIIHYAEYGAHGIDLFPGQDRFVAVTAAGNANFYDLSKSARPFALGAVQPPNNPTGYRLVSEDGRDVVVGQDDGPWFYFDTTSGGQRVALQGVPRPKARSIPWRVRAGYYTERGSEMDVMDLDSVSLAPSGAVLLVTDHAGAWSAFNLRDGGRRIEVGALQSAVPNTRPWAVSGDYLVVRRTDGEGLLWRLSQIHSSPHAPPINELRLGAIRKFWFTQDGNVLFAQRPDGQSDLYDLTRGAQAVPLGVLDSGSEGNAQSLLMRRADGSSIIYNMHNGALVELGRVRTSRLTGGGILTQAEGDLRWTYHDNNWGNLDVGAIDEHYSYGEEEPIHLAENGTSFVFRRPNGQWILHDLRHRSAPMLLGALSQNKGDVQMTRDGSVLATRDADGVVSVYDLMHGSARRSFGRFDAMYLSANGRTLLTRDSQGVGRVHDTVANDLPPSSRGEALVGVVCASENDDVLPVRLRSSDSSLLTDERERRIHWALRGRPWSPCDWRGLLAIFPNASRGDGWFEGLSQWWRLVSVRYFGGRDWACEETTSRSAVATRDLRRETCPRSESPRSVSDAELRPYLGIWRLESGDAATCMMQSDGGGPHYLRLTTNGSALSWQNYLGHRWINNIDAAPLRDQTGRLGFVGSRPENPQFLLNGENLRLFVNGEPACELERDSNPL